VKEKVTLKIIISSQTNSEDGMVQCQIGSEIITKLVLGVEKN
jgi:hypothetical protein